MTVLEFKRIRLFGPTVISNMSVLPGKAASMSVYASDSSTNPIYRARLNSGSRLSKTALRLSSNRAVFKFFANGSGGSDEEVLAKVKVQFTSGRAFQIGNKIGDVKVR